MGPSKKRAKRRATSAFMKGVAVGAAAAYVLDPAEGKRRRGRLRDQLIHDSRRSAELVGKGARDVAHRARGVVAEARGALVADAPADEVVVDRIRAELGRLVSHPHAIDVSVASGLATLSGPVLAGEAERLRRGVERIRGVLAVQDELEVHESAEGVPALQGGRAIVRRRSAAWPPGQRLLAVVAGAGLFGFGRSLRRETPLGHAVCALGLALGARGVVNRPFFMVPRELEGDAAAFHIQKTMDIHAPVEQVFAVLAHPEALSRIVRQVREVRSLDERRARWKVVGPAGLYVGFESQIVELEHGRVLSWKAADHAFVRHTGVLRFEPTAQGGTRIDLKVSYTPPLGMIGRALMALVRAEPKRFADEALLRVKSVLENGKTHVNGKVVDRAEVLAASAPPPAGPSPELSGPAPAGP